jgi:polysaccharide chain length determinant protein (PEP-CTERM system associated)
VPLAEQLLRYVRDLWRMRWRALVAAWLICLLAWPVILLLPNRYEAHASVYVNTTSALQPMLKGLAVETDLMSQLELVQQLLLSHDGLEKVARETKVIGDDVPAKVREIRITDLRERIKITGGRNARDNLYTITFRDRDPATAQNVVRSLLDTFVERTIGAKHSASDSAQRFLLGQKQDYEARLVEAENKLVDFRRQNMGMLPGEHRDYFARMQDALDRRAASQRGLDQAKAEKRQIQEQLAGQSPVNTIAGASPEGVPGQPGYGRSSIDRRIQEAEEKLSAMRAEWTDKHPAVIAQRQQLEELRAERQRYLKALGVNGNVDPSMAIENNPVYQSLRVALNQVDLKIVQYTAEIATESATIEELERLEDTVPKVEAEYQQLTRDYNVINTQYQEVVKRLETARLSGEAEQSEEVDFRTIQPATVDASPVAPKRLLLLPGAFAAAVGLGIWLALMLSRLHPVFYTSREITAATGLPVLGLVDSTSAGRGNKGYIGFAAAALSLAVTFSAVLLLGFRDVGWLSALRSYVP